MFDGLRSDLEDQKDSILTSSDWPQHRLLVEETKRPKSVVGIRIVIREYIRCSCKASCRGLLLWWCIHRNHLLLDSLPFQS